MKSHEILQLEVQIRQLADRNNHLVKSNIELDLQLDQLINNPLGIEKVNVSTSCSGSDMFDLFAKKVDELEAILYAKELEIEGISKTFDKMSRAIMDSNVFMKHRQNLDAELESKFEDLQGKIESLETMFHLFEDDFHVQRNALDYVEGRAESLFELIKSTTIMNEGNSIIDAYLGDKELLIVNDNMNQVDFMNISQIEFEDIDYSICDYKMKNQTPIKQLISHTELSDDGTLSRDVECFPPLRHSPMLKLQDDRSKKCPQPSSNPVLTENTELNVQPLIDAGMNLSNNFQ
jgi:hypothetical protein